ncbi:MAG: hypothetical protein JNM57_07090 [Cyclobacteriaceae bacterium]|nr:hypothetical protein [Cyclobacteriaceae bacterium]
MEDEHSNSIPLQKAGNELSVEHSVEASSIEEARIIFDQAVSRMLDVNQWHVLTGSLLSVFELTDNDGNGINRQQACVNDFFKINLPGPGSQAGEGYDWVQVEWIKHQQEILNVPDSMTMRVRPVANPLDHEAGTAHFFKDTATSTFKVSRDGLTITAAVYGRNEIPNTEGNVIDTIRNTAVAFGAKLGGAHLQWQSLAKGILNDTKILS